MNRRALVLAAVLATADALLPEPPIPPDQPPADQAAPVPNPDAHAPVAPGPAGTRVRPEMFRKGTYDPSLGYATGSRYQDNEERKLIQTPGMRLLMPIP